MSNQLANKSTSSFSSLRWLIICRMPHGMRIALRLAQICRSLQTVSVVEITTPIADWMLDILTRVSRVTRYQGARSRVAQIRMRTSRISTLYGGGRGHSIAIYIERKLDMRHMDVQRSDTNPIVQAV